ncbi:SPT20 SAGA complex component [Apodemus speciosus]|uniref:SPT20 SAGA complex component n=1 Tax=Apodemus speciosus TaxID=105296 RepID=A0ABQ0FUR4_APOSI
MILSRVSSMSLLQPDPRPLGKNLFMKNCMTFMLRNVEKTQKWRAFKAMSTC